MEYKEYVGGGIGLRNVGGGTKFLGDPAEGRIAKMCLGMVRTGVVSGRAKRGWAENGREGGRAKRGWAENAKKGVTLDFKGQNDSKYHL